MDRNLIDDKKGMGIFWGWYVVCGSFTIMLISYGIRYSFGVFVKPMFVEYHWPMTIIQLGSSINLIMYAFSSVLAGGGFKGGQVVGASNEKGTDVRDRPVYPWDLIGSMYQLMGIDPTGTMPNSQGLTVNTTPLADDGIESGGLLTEIM